MGIQPVQDVVRCWRNTGRCRYVRWTCQSSSRTAVQCCRSERHRTGIDEGFRDGIDAQVESLQRSRAKQDQVVGFPEYDLIHGECSGGVNKGGARPALEDGAIGLTESQAFEPGHAGLFQHSSRQA